MNPYDDIEMLSQPLLTEDGFINPACMNELEAAIANMPPTYERLSNDPEWSTPIVVNVKQITGYFANWAVRQGDYKPFPPNLEKLIGYLDACLRKDFLAADNKQTEEEWGRFSLCQINKMLWDILDGVPEFIAWNTEECLGKDWLDLHALLHNVCLGIRDEKRIFDDFDRRFEEEHGKLKSPE